MGTFFITGSTGGIGTDTALALAREGHRLLLGARSDNPAAVMLQRLHREVPGVDVEIVLGDLSLVSDVRRVAEAVATLAPSLDGLLLNAGTAPSRRKLTADGFETGFAVNHLGAFVLAHKLLPLLARSETARIVLTGSSDHIAVKQIDVQAASKGDSFSYTRSYAEAKFLAMASMLELARQLRQNPDRSNVIVNIADPGWTHTGLTRQAPMPIKVLVALGRPFQNSTADAARVLADLAMNATASGQFIGSKGASKLSDLVQNSILQAQAYNETLQLLQSMDEAPVLAAMGSAG